MRKSVIIVAGGIGKRMKSTIPKQFLLLGNQPVLMHSITAFYDFDPGIDIILVLPESQKAEWNALCERYDFQIKHRVCAGGSQRFHSVKNGLSQMLHQGLVAIHDGVRPLVSKKTIKACFELAEELGNVIPSLPVNESIRQITEGANRIFDRNILRSIQTPQVFRTDEIINAYLQDYLPSFTDDASVLERTGQKINLCEGNTENIKITSPVDLLFAESILSRKNKDIHS